MCNCNKHLLRFILLLTLVQCSFAQESVKNQSYFYYPKSFNTWHYGFVVGVSVTKLPIQIVEDEINTAPMQNNEFRLGLSKRADLHLQFNWNYIANNGMVGFKWMVYENVISLALGENTSVWFGHLELEAIRLKSMGVVVSPVVTIGYNAQDFLISANMELQNSYMKTLSHDILIGEFFKPLSALSFQFHIEQPFWNNHWVDLGIKLTYAKFYYMSWLAYSTLDTYLFYPEFSFGFIL